MRLLMMGTGPFAVPTFEALLDSDHEVIALVTRPSKPSSGRRKAPVNPMREVAVGRELPVLEPDSVNDTVAHAQLADLRADLFVVCDYGQILAEPTLALSRLGGINLHGSLLPKYRGAAPVNWAIYHGDAITGVTVIYMSVKLDAGPCLVRRETKIGEDETHIELEKRLSLLGVDAVHESLAMLDAWDGSSPIGTIQDKEQVTQAPRLRRDNGHVDWTRTATQISNQVRAFKPWPNTFSNWQRPGGEPMRLILDAVSVVRDADVLDADAPDAVTGPPGSVVHCDGKQLWISTGDGVLSLDRVQPAGKRAMAIDDFLRGHQVGVGDCFGPLPE